MKIGTQRIIENVRQDLKVNVDEKYKCAVKRFFKEKITCYGARTPIVRKIAKKYFKDIKNFDKKEIFNLSEQLLKSDYSEEATIATEWIFGIKDRLIKTDFNIFEKWLKKYINNWGKDDDFCAHIIHPIIVRYPELVENVKLWATSKNQWVRRASAVSFIKTLGYCHTTKHNLDDIFDIAKILLYDEKDLVQKGYGWMLKSASVHHQKEVFDFVMIYKKNMPRTALRYAIEKMPKHLKNKAMDKD